MIANDNAINAFDPTSYLQKAVAEGREDEITTCLMSSVLLLKSDQDYWLGQNRPDEAHRVELEHNVRLLCDTFFISHTVPNRLAGNAIITSLLHNAARYLALGIQQGGANEKDSIDACLERLRMMTENMLQEIRKNAGQ